MEKLFAPLRAVDALGRTLPDAREAGLCREKKLVGMFYFLWLTPRGEDGPWDITKILQQDPQAGYHPESELWGPWNSMHHWGEALYGYYSSLDEWVVRRHIEMLTLAGVDFLVFDTTNRATYLPEASLVMKVVSELRAQGHAAPQVAYYTNTDSAGTVQEIYETVYQARLYPEAWFCLHGKPLIIGDASACSEEIQQYFYFRCNQWPNEEYKPGGFPWMDFLRPQRVFTKEDGKESVLNVSLAQHPQLSHGDSVLYGETRNWSRSFHDGKNDPAPDAVLYGYNAQEQWDIALEADPEIVFVTGWNEWIAGRFSRENMSRGYKSQRPIFFCDNASANYSRDIEPMRGGYFDNYYMQLVEQVRRFKGVEVDGVDTQQHTISAENGFAAWEQVSASYWDFAGETVARDCRGHGSYYYENETGQNDICQVKLTSDDANVYFYVRTAQPVRQERLWLKWFLRTGEEPGWNGYQYTLEPQTHTVSRWLNGSFKPVATFEWTVCQNEFMAVVSKAQLGLAYGKTPFALGFKVADGILDDGTVEDFYENGDTAPFGRFYYLYRYLK